MSIRNKISIITPRVRRARTTLTRTHVAFFLPSYSLGEYVCEKTTNIKRALIVSTKN